MSTHEHLSAASNDRKARLAQLKSLKRKQPSPDPSDSTAPASTALTTASPSVTTTYLSGRNFDPETRTVKLGFSHPPTASTSQTLESQAAALALATAAEQTQLADDQPLDLFKLQPKKPNWDLKRDLEEKMREGGLEAGFENAVVRLVRERVGRQRVGSGEGGEEGEGLEGGELVEGLRVREEEEERERRREVEEEG